MSVIDLNAARAQHGRTLPPWLGRRTLARRIAGFLGVIPPYSCAAAAVLDCRDPARDAIEREALRAWCGDDAGGGQ